MSLKAKVGRVAPGWVVRAYRRAATAREFFIDYVDYAASTAWHKGAGRRDHRRDEREVLEARLTLAYHGIEKGASFPTPKRPYGLAKKAEVEAILSAAARTGLDLDAGPAAQQAVEALDYYNATGNISDIVTPSGAAQLKAFEPEDIEKFVATRNSVRNFDVHRTIPRAVVKQIIRLASATPSVCNRRAYRAHYFDDRTSIDQILTLQNGNTGFGHTVPGLIVVTERRSSFVGAGERNQRWVDGGLFSMSVVWLAHAFQLGSCFLNWSQTNATSRRLREVAGIRSDEDIVVLIAIGYPAHNHRVARSPLRPSTDVFVLHDE